MDANNVSATAKLAYAMAAEQHIAFDDESHFAEDPYEGYLAFRKEAQADRDGSEMPELMSPWNSNMHSTKGEILDDLETDAAVIMAAFNTILGYVKEGIVQAALHDNLPQDMSQLNMDQIVNRGQEAEENERLCKQLEELQSQKERSAEQQAEMDRITSILIEREAPLPF